ncbi:MAG: DNA alkylation repair protein [Armatimonadota bacterium]
MTESTLLAECERLGTDMMRRHHAKNGWEGPCHGVKMGDLRALAKPLKKNTALARVLWATGVLDAMLVAVLIVKPAELSAEDVGDMVSRANYNWLADWVNTHVVKVHAAKERFRTEWIDHTDPWRRRAAWSLTVERLSKDPGALDPSALLEKIDHELSDAPEAARWTMNYCLAEIGIRHAELRDRAIAIGERHGAYRDYPTSKGCTSPYAPTWIAAMVAREGTPT